MTTYSHGNAYPIIDSSGEVLANGLTKREYFAALAMQGFASNSSLSWALDEDPQVEIGKLAVAQADALISALNT